MKLFCGTYHVVRHVLFLQDLVAGFDCVCISGWTGANCQTNIDDCVSNPCMNGGTCMVSKHSNLCEC